MQPGEPQIEQGDGEPDDGKSGGKRPRDQAREFAMFSSVKSVPSRSRSLSALWLKNLADRLAIALLVVAEEEHEHGGEQAGDERGPADDTAGRIPFERGTALTFGGGAGRDRSARWVRSAIGAAIESGEGRRPQRGQVPRRRRSCRSAPKSAPPCRPNRDRQDRAGAARDRKARRQEPWRLRRRRTTPPIRALNLRR